MIHDRAGQAAVFDENERVTHGRGHGRVSASVVQNCNDIHGDEKLVLNN
jgi:hypothetical protein